MKYVKRSIPVIVLLALIACAVLLVHPVRVYTSTSYSYRLMFTGVKNELVGIGDIAGGCRAYLDDNHYVHLSWSDCEAVNEDEEIYLRYNWPWKLPTLNRGGGSR